MKTVKFDIYQYIIDKYQKYIDFQGNGCYNNTIHTGGIIMSVDYSNLWKLLIDKRMNKSQLREAAKISTNAIAKLGRNESVSLDTLEKICCALSCSIEDIMTFTSDSFKGE